MVFPFLKIRARFLKRPLHSEADIFLCSYSRFLKRPLHSDGASGFVENS